jgi:hypothetical protein
MPTTSNLSLVHDPDGVPHEIVGLTWLVALTVAIGAFAALTIGGVVSVLALILMPASIVAVARRAARRRDARVVRNRR